MHCCVREPSLRIQLLDFARNLRLVPIFGIRLTHPLSSLLANSGKDQLPQDWTTTAEP